MRCLVGVLELSAQVFKATLRLPAGLATAIAPDVACIQVRLGSGRSESLCGPLDFPAGLARAVAPDVACICVSYWCSCSADGGNSHDGREDNCGDLHFEGVVWVLIVML